MPHMKPHHAVSHTQDPTDATMSDPLEEPQDLPRPSLSPNPDQLEGIPKIITSPSPDRNIFTRPLPAHEPTIDPRKSPTTIPPEHKHRTLVLCFDGTGDQFDADNSNIVQLFSLLKKDDRSKQMAYYQSGIGTYTSPKVATPLMTKASGTLDEMVAWNLDAHVMDGYEFLMQNYTAGDRICIFGFSRGAYTARALAGMLHKVGLLPASNHQQVPFAYKMFTRADPVGWEQSDAFKKAFSTDVSIEFLGVWDTVSSVGLIPRRLPFTTSNTLVHTFRHAVSLDERRAKFKANLWNLPMPHETQLGTFNPPPSTPRPSTEGGGSMPSMSEKPTHEHRSSFVKNNSEEHLLSTLEHMYSEIRKRPTDVEEVWFAGCHCDVGGGSVSDKTPHSLARISLRWMVRECFKANTGIMFDAERLKTIGLDPSTLYPFVTPRPPPLPVGNARIAKAPKQPKKRPFAPMPVPPLSANSMANKAPDPRKSVSEEEEELKDVMSPIYDQLRLKPFWWLLEWIPMEFRYQTGEDNHWVSYFGMNRGRSRVIPKQDVNGVKVHRSVKMRMEMLHESNNPKKQKKYTPRAKFFVEPTWVD